MSRDEARVLANKHRRRAKRAWEEEWDLKAEGFWTKQAESVAKAHGLQLRTYTCAGHFVTSQYV